MNDILKQYHDTIRLALERKTPLKIRGSGTKDFYGNPTSGELFDTTAYSGVIDYDPAELVITARCGTPLAEIENLLATKNQMLAFEPPYFGSAATLGGSIATGLSGPRRASAGAVRDFMLGVKILNGLGEELTFGGRVIKNVAGYDVSRLIAGSMGTLGVVLEASLKVLPKPPFETSLRFEMVATSAIEKVNCWVGSGIPITASCHLDNALTIRLSGSENTLSGFKQKLGGDEIDMPEQFWNSIKEQSHEFFKTNSNLWRISLKSSALPLKLTGKQLMEWNGNLRWYVGDASATAVRNFAKKDGGHATLFRGNNDSESAFHPLPVLMLNLQKRLKGTFDPQGIFNPGRLYPEL